MNFEASNQACFNYLTQTEKKQFLKKLTTFKPFEFLVIPILLTFNISLSKKEGNLSIFI